MKTFFIALLLPLCHLYAQNDGREITYLQAKYAVILDTEAENIVDTFLYSTIEKWKNVKYVRGGFSKRGIDCSGLTRTIYSEVYGKEIPPVSWLQHKQSSRIPLDSLREGDLIFFRFSRTWHVALYLQNSFFVHATRKRGVTFGSLQNSYWKKYIVGFGRVE